MEPIGGLAQSEPMVRRMLLKYRARRFDCAGNHGPPKKPSSVRHNDEPHATRD